MGLPAGVREEHLCLAWQHGLLVRERLCTTRGELLQVVFAGRRSGEPGPDFRDAVLALPDATLIKGDVEVHKAVDGWAAHGHDANPTYDRVVLHVTWEGGAEVCTSAGAPVRSLALAGCLALSPAALAALAVAPRPPAAVSCPAALGEGTPAGFPPLLEWLGQERLEQHAIFLGGAMAAVGPGQAIWAALLRGLGYRRNTAPFARLAEAVPWSVVAHLAARPDGWAEVEALLLGAAGFLSAPGPPLPEADEAQRARRAERWRTLAARCVAPPLDRAAWTLAGVRPENAPSRRVAAAAALAVAYQAGLAAAVREQALATEIPIRLSLGRSDPYWATHADFGRGLGARSLALLGAARERELLVNAVLPALLALARDERDATLEAAVRTHYAALPGSGGNSLTRYMLQTVGAAPRVARSAAAEQGLLHLYHRWCRERRCWECPLPAVAATITPAAEEGSGVHI